MKSIWKQVILFISFLTYIIAIFFIHSYILLAICLLLNIFFVILWKIDWRKISYSILKLLPFIVFTAILNGLFSNLINAILISIRLLLVCQITYIFSQRISTFEVGKIIEKILKPLQIIGIHTENIGIIISISICFIPIMKQEIQNLINSLNSKGFSTNFINILFHPQLVFYSLFVSIFHRIDEIELSLLSKGYII